VCPGGVPGRCAWEVWVVPGRCAWEVCLGGVGRCGEVLGGERCAWEVRQRRRCVWEVGLAVELEKE
jgi:hypothetical protein